MTVENKIRAAKFFRHFCDGVFAGGRRAVLRPLRSATRRPKTAARISPTGLTRLFQAGLSVPRGTVFFLLLPSPRAGRSTAAAAVSPCSRYRRPVREVLLKPCLPAAGEAALGGGHSASCRVINQSKFRRSIKMKRKCKLILAILMATVLIISMSVSFGASHYTEQTFSDENCSVSFYVTFSTASSNAAGSGSMGCYATGCNFDISSTEFGTDWDNTDNSTTVSIYGVDYNTTVGTYYEMSWSYMESATPSNYDDGTVWTRSV